MKLRLKIVEEGIKHASSLSTNGGIIGSIKAENSSNILGFLTSNGGITKWSTIVEHEKVSDEPRQTNSSTNSGSGDNMLRKSLRGT